MIFKISGICNTGLVREINEDAILMDLETGLFAVADGVGGLPNGQLASRTAVDSLDEVYKLSPDVSAEVAVHLVNEMCRKVGFKKYHFGFATTLTFAKWIEDKSGFELAHVGDSGAAHVRGSDVEFITLEHTVAAKIYENTPKGSAPVISPIDYHTLTQCIGQDSKIKPQTLFLPFQIGDRLFIYSDGVSKALDDDHLAGLLGQDKSIEDLVKEIADKVEKAGAPDNYSIVGIQSAAG